MPLLSWAFTILPSYTPSVMVFNLYYLEHQCSPLDLLLSCMSNVMVSNIYYLEHQNLTSIYSYMPIVMVSNICFLQLLHWVGNKYMPSSLLCSHSHTLLPGEVVHTQFCHWRHTELYIVARSQLPLCFFLGDQQQNAVGFSGNNLLHDGVLSICGVRSIFSILSN